MLTLIELLNFISRIVDVLAQFHSVLDRIINGVNAIKELNLFEGFLIGLKTNNEFVFLFVQTLQEILLLSLDFRVALLDHVTNLHGPHLLTQSLYDVILLVEEAVFIEKFLV